MIIVFGDDTRQSWPRLAPEPAIVSSARGGRDPHPARRPAPPSRPPPAPARFPGRAALRHPACRDQIAHTPLTTENPQPTAHVQAAAHHRRRPVPAPSRAPRTARAVKVNSRGSGPKSAIPARICQPGTPPVQGSISAPSSDQHRDRHGQRRSGPGRPGARPPLHLGQLGLQRGEVVRRALVHRSLPSRPPVTPQPRRPTGGLPAPASRSRAGPARRGLRPATG